MAAVYFDIDQFGYTKEIHKLLTREFGKMEIVTKKFIGSRKSDMGNLPQEIDGPHEKILCEKKAGEKDKVDFRITIEIMKDLRNPDIHFFVIASRDTDFITIAEEVHRHGKNFGVLVIHNSKEKLSPKLKDFCDMILTIQDGKVTRGNHKIKKPAPLEFHEMSVQTESEPKAQFSTLEVYKSNLVLAWIDYNCRGYKNIAVELDNMMKQMKQNSKDSTLNFHALHRDQSNQLFAPPTFSCECGPFPNPIHRPECSPIFHLYQDGVIKQEVVGANLKALRKAIGLVYKVII